jgi:hypothetical protein
LKEPWKEGRRGRWKEGRRGRWKEGSRKGGRMEKEAGGKESKSGWILPGSRIFNKYINSKAEAGGGAR